MFLHKYIINISQQANNTAKQVNSNNNNNQAFYSQASWGRLEMKPHKQKKKNRYKTKAKKKEKKKGDKKIK
jgi:hypothetical protein